MPSESKFLLKKKLMTGSKETKLNITKNLVEKIAELLNAEVHYSYLLNHKGEEKRKISIVYKEEWNKHLYIQMEVKNLKEQKWFLKRVVKK